MSYIKKFSEFIKESIDVDSFEDINTLSVDDICDYLINVYPKYQNPFNRHYQYPTKDILKSNEDGISIQIVTNVDFIISNTRGQYECFLHFDKKIPEEKKRGYFDVITDICSLEKDNVEGIECIKVSPLDSEVLTLDFCVNVIDRISESDPNNAYYIKA